MIQPFWLYLLTFAIGICVAHIASHCEKMAMSPARRMLAEAREKKYPTPSIFWQIMAAILAAWVMDYAGEITDFYTLGPPPY
jgi:hypothetical protein